MYQVIVNLNNGIQKDFEFETIEGIEFFLENLMRGEYWATDDIDAVHDKVKCDLHGWQNCGCFFECSVCMDHWEKERRSQEEAQMEDEIWDQIMRI